MNALRTRPFALPRISSTALPRAASRRSYAHLSLVGRLGATPERTPTSTGRDIIKYSVGTSYGAADRRETSWFRVTFFPAPQSSGGLQDVLVALPKGTLVAVNAETRLRTYQDADGSKRMQLDCIQHSIEILSRPRNNDAGQGGAAAEEGRAEEGAQAASG